MADDVILELDKNIAKAWSLALSDQPTAISLYNDALATAERIGYRKGLGRCLLGLGRIFCFQRRLNESLAKLEQALPILEELEDHVGVAYVYSYTAGDYLYFPVPPFETAHEFMLKALAMAEKSGDAEATVRILLNLGEVLQEWGKNEDALAAYRRVVDTAGTHQNQEITYLAYGYMGKTLHQLRRDAEAIPEFERSIAGSKEIGRTFLQIEILPALGTSLIEVGRIDEARTRLEEALTLGESIDERNHTTRACMTLAKLDTDAGDLEAADLRLRRALENAEILDSAEWKHRALSALSELTERRGDPGTALAYLKQCHAAYQALQQNDFQEKARARDFELKREREQQEIEAQHRGKQIQSLVLPMIESIEQVSGAIQEKLGTIQRLNQLTEESYSKIGASNDIISRVATDVNQMATMVDVINEISATVNLLALNAKIESAHAGKFGRGFSVIAGEISKLSDTTQNQAEGIAKTLSAVIDGAQESSTASQEGFAKIKDMGESMTEVQEFLKSLSAQMTQLTQNSMSILGVMREVEEVQKTSH